MNEPAIPSFENAMVELERILRGLEDGSTTLDEGLSAYERGVRLLKICHGQIRDAEQRIATISGLDAEGKLVTQPFNHSASDGETASKPTTRPKPKTGSGMY